MNEIAKSAIANKTQQYYAEAQNNASRLASVADARDISPVEMALNELAKVLEVGHNEMLELRTRLIPVTNHGGEKAAMVGDDDKTGPSVAAQSQIEARIWHLTECAAILQGSLREMRVGLRI